MKYCHAWLIYMNFLLCQRFFCGLLLPPAVGLWDSKCFTCYSKSSHQFNVDMPNYNTTIYMHWTLIFEWYAVRCVSSNGHQKRHIFKRDWTSFQNILIVLGSIVDTIRGDQYDHLKFAWIFTSIMFMMSNMLKEWIGAIVASLSCQFLVISTQENTQSIWET